MRNPILQLGNYLARNINALFIILAVLVILLTLVQING